MHNGKSLQAQIQYDTIDFQTGIIYSTIVLALYSTSTQHDLSHYTMLGYYLKTLELKQKKISKQREMEIAQRLCLVYQMYWLAFLELDIGDPGTIE